MGAYTGLFLICFGLPAIVILAVAFAYRPAERITNALNSKEK